MTTMENGTNERRKIKKASSSYRRANKKPSLERNNVIHLFIFPLVRFASGDELESNGKDVISWSSSTVYVSHPRTPFLRNISITFSLFCYIVSYGDAIFAQSLHTPRHPSFFSHASSCSHFSSILSRMSHLST